MLNQELMLTPAVLLEAMHSKERVRRRLEAIIQAQAEGTQDTVEPADDRHRDDLAISEHEAAVGDEGLLVFN